MYPMANENPPFIRARSKTLAPSGSFLRLRALFRLYVTRVPMLRFSVEREIGGLL